MANQQHNPRPIAPEHAPDTARTYERAKPEKEAGMGRLDNNTRATPAKSPDQMEDAVTHRQANRQINSDDVVNQRAQNPADGAAVNPSADNPRDQRQPKTGGNGGTR